MVECKDKKCPFHGGLSLRGRTFKGVVSSTKRFKTATIEWSRLSKVPKYERYEVRWTKVHAHIPDCMKVNENDIAEISETRPLSKTKNFVITKILGKKEEVKGEDVTEIKKAKKIAAEEAKSEKKRPRQRAGKAEENESS